MMTFWKGLFELLRLKCLKGRRILTFEESIELALVELAKQDKKPVEEKASDLMAWAIDQGQAGVDFEDRWLTLSRRDQQVTLAEHIVPCSLRDIVPLWDPRSRAKGTSYS
jgi:hypothetical protein